MIRMNAYKIKIATFSLRSRQTWLAFNFGSTYSSYGLEFISLIYSRINMMPNIAPDQLTTRSSEKSLEIQDKRSFCQLTSKHFLQTSCTAFIAFIVGVHS